VTTISQQDYHQAVAVLVPLPSTDFDPTESAVPWHILTSAGHEIVFTTPDGKPAAADERVLTGRGFGPFRPLLRARADAIALYAKMSASPAFRTPRRWQDTADDTFDAVLLPGGHAPGMLPYLESPILQAIVAAHLTANKPLAAICHGVILAARSVDPKTRRSVLAGRRSTALTRSMELSAWGMTGLWLGRYYRTYPETVQSEVTRALGSEGLFEEGPFALRRDSPEHLDRGFVVRDANYLSARWPGDAYRLATTLLDLLSNT
jgi:protease I